MLNRFSFFDYKSACIWFWNTKFVSEVFVVKILCIILCWKSNKFVSEVHWRIKLCTPSWLSACWSGWFSPLVCALMSRPVPYTFNINTSCIFLQPLLVQEHNSSSFLLNMIYYLFSRLVLFLSKFGESYWPVHYSPYISCFDIYIIHNNY